MEGNVANMNGDENMNEEFNVNEADKRAHDLARLRVVCRYSLLWMMMFAVTCAYVGPRCGATPNELHNRTEDARAAGHAAGVAEECRRWTR
jgi:hypothetical protein